jgi:hypothetical protein
MILESSLLLFSQQSMRFPQTTAIGPKAHWVKKWFEVFRKPECTVDINMTNSIACLAPLGLQLAGMYPKEVGYPIDRPIIGNSDDLLSHVLGQANLGNNIGHEDVVFISPIRESFNENECQLPWELAKR